MFFTNSNILSEKNANDYLTQTKIKKYVKILEINNYYVYNFCNKR